jgi:hypothetical protein
VRVVAEYPPATVDRSDQPLHVERGIGSELHDGNIAGSALRRSPDQECVAVIERRHHRRAVDEYRKQPMWTGPKIGFGGVASQLARPPALE